jgi:hypothetical protein
MTGLLLEMTTPRERLTGIRTELSDGSTPGEICLLLLSLATFIALLYILYRVQREQRRPEIDDSRKLFRTLLTDLGLPVPHRDVLRRVVRDLNLVEPAVMLLAPRLYWAHAQKWLEGNPARERSRVMLTRVAAFLFPAESDNAEPSDPAA